MRRYEFGALQGGHGMAAPRLSGFLRVGRTCFAVALAALTCFSWPGAARAGSTQIVVQATVLSRSNCRFDTNRSTLDFGSIDAAGSSDASATVAVSYVCRGSAPVAAFAFSRDDGRYASGSGNPRMRHAADPSAFLPYSLSLNPSSGTVPKNVHQNLAVTGTVRAVDYRAAAAGNYSDTVTLTILP